MTKAKTIKRHRELVPLSDLLAAHHPDNPKDHDIGQIVTAIKDAGVFTRPIVINERDGFLLLGHGSTKALSWMKREGDKPPDGVEVRGSDGEWLVPTERGIYLGKRKAAKVRVADNRTSELGGWDNPKLAEVLEYIAGTSPARNLSGTGFDPEDLDQLLADLKGYTPQAGDHAPDESLAAEFQAKWGVKDGDIWAIPSETSRRREHRLIVGDAADPAVLQRLMGDDVANLLVTSPPYWIGKEYEQERSEQDIRDFIDRCVVAWVPFVSRDLGRVVINTGTSPIHKIEGKRPVEQLILLAIWQQAFGRYGWLLRHVRIWAKTGQLIAGGVSPRSDVVSHGWEELAEFADGEAPELEISPEDQWAYIGSFWEPEGEYRGQEKASKRWALAGLWDDIPGERSADGTHVAAFPIELPRRNIFLYSKRGEIVVDPFVGSGTTMAACEQVGRVGYGVELLPKYAAVTLERMERMGLEPRRI